ncbi:hypothetical protein, partial [Planomonospora algeriensis]
GPAGRGRPRWRWVLAGLAVVAALAVTGVVLANVVGGGLGGGQGPATPSASAGGGDAGATWAAGSHSAPPSAARS